MPSPPLDWISEVPSASLAQGCKASGRRFLYISIRKRNSLPSYLLSRRAGISGRVAVRAKGQCRKPFHRENSASENVGGSKAPPSLIYVWVRTGAHAPKSVIIFLKLISKAASCVWRLSKMKTIPVCRHCLTGRGLKEKLNNERAKGTRGRNLKCKASGASTLIEKRLQGKAINRGEAGTKRAQGKLPGDRRKREQRGWG